MNDVARWNNKEFHSLDDFGYEDLLEALNDWQEGKVASWDVSSFAKELGLLEEHGWPDPPVDDHRFILFEIGHLLENLYGNYTFKEDIPALKRALQLGQIRPQEALDELNAYFDEVDFDAREKLISGRFAQGLLWPP